MSRYASGLRLTIVPSTLPTARMRGFVITAVNAEGTFTAALDPADLSVAYLMRLAVLPEFRCRGFGAMLVQHIISQARRSAMSSISIGLIAEQSELAAWYRKLGFIPGETKRFKHLPFTVRYMTCPLLPDAPKSI